MIPERKEPQVNATMCFGREQSALLEKAVDQISLSGRTIVMDSGHQAYTRYCLRAMVDQLARSSDQSDGSSPIKVRRVRQEREVIVMSLNASIKGLNLSSSHARSAVNTREIWIFENTQSSSAEEAVFASNLIKQFKSAGVSIIITGRSVGAGQTNIERLAEQTKGMPFIFDLPEFEESRQLYQQAKLMGNGSEYAALMKEIGQPVEKNTNPAIVAFSEVAALESDQALNRDYQELVSPLSENDDFSTYKLSWQFGKKLLYVGGCTALAMLLASLPMVFDFDKTVRWFSDLNLASLSQWYENSGNKEESSTESKDFVTVAESISKDVDVDNLIIEPLILPRSLVKDDAASTVLETDKDVRQNKTGLVENEAVTEGAAQEPSAVSAAIASPLSQTIAVSSNETQAVKRADTLGSIVEEGWFVQHASFRVPQRAFLWKRNQRLEADLRVYSKGENNPRFVVVSGPFETRDFAKQYLANNNMGNDKFFVKGDKLGDRIYP